MSAKVISSELFVVVSGLTATHPHPHPRPYSHPHRHFNCVVAVLYSIFCCIYIFIYLYLLSNFCTHFYVTPPIYTDYKIVCTIVAPQHLFGLFTIIIIVIFCCCNFIYKLQN